MNQKEKIVFGYKNYFGKCQDVKLLAQPYWQKFVNNTGNEIFCTYTSLNIPMLDIEKTIGRTDIWNNDNNCYILLPANILANHCKEVLTSLTDTLSKNACQTLVMSLGAQATLDEMKNPKKYAENLIPEAKKFAHLVSSKSVSIGVRGEFTYNVLHELGIKNVENIGCTSYFVNGYNQPQIMKKAWSLGLNPICFATTAEKNTWAHKIISEAFKFKKPKYIIQNEFKILPYYFFANNYFGTGLKCIKDIKPSMKYIKKMFGISYKDMLFNNKVQNLFEIFLNINKWEDFIKTRDFVFGMRIHGSIIALKQGIPAMVIAHDSRLVEMCDLFNIPYIRIDKMNAENFNLQKFYEESDYTLMNKNYNKLLENYIAFLDKNEIQHNFK